jgi:hypothetical protein
MTRFFTQLFLITAALAFSLAAIFSPSSMVFAEDRHKVMVDAKALDLWVFAGQSNSQGWALLKAPVPTNPHVFFFDTAGQWVQTREPLNKEFTQWTPGPWDSNILLQRQNITIPHGQSVAEFLKKQRSESSDPLGGVGPGLMFASRLQVVTRRNIGLDYLRGQS